MATFNFKFDFGILMWRDSLWSHQKLVYLPKTGKKFSHVVSKVGAHSFGARFSR